MKPIQLLTVVCCLFMATFASSQELDRSTTISVFTGVMNYQGDVKPNNFTMSHSNLALGVTIRKPLTRWISLRAGYNQGSISGSDSWNTEDLKPRNLSFNTDIKEAYAGIEINILDMSSSRFAPYVYAGLAFFHFNPWTFDKNGEKVFLQPLSTEGQGMTGYPQSKPYKLTQMCIPFGGGARFMVLDGINLGVEFNQRKSFTDHIDDVSGAYVDPTDLLQQRGIKAVELSYRADELPGSRPIFPAKGEKRGTPTEMDWYYFLGLTLEAKISTLGGLFRFNKSHFVQKCPRNVGY